MQPSQEKTSNLYAVVPSEDGFPFFRINENLLNCNFEDCLIAYREDEKYLIFPVTDRESFSRLEFVEVGKNGNPTGVSEGTLELMRQENQVAQSYWYEEWEKTLRELEWYKAKLEEVQGNGRTQ